MGYGAVLSDTCVTFLDGSTADLVQKAYPVGRFIVGGFAGGIRNGFILLGDLQRHLYEPDMTRAWNPEIIAEDWSRNAMMIYENHSDYQKDMETHILLTGAHPTEDAGIPGFAKIIGVIMKSPDFHPEFYFGNMDMYSIGSGNYVDEYLKLLAEIRKDWPKLIQAEVGKNPGGYARMLDSLVNQAIFENPVPGISSYINHLIVGRNSLNGGASKRTDHPPGKEPFVHPRPPVATSWPEFVRMVNAQGTGTKAESAVG